MSNQRYDTEAHAAWSWWHRLQPHERNGRVVPGDRAAIARLRRIANVMEAFAEPASVDLYRQLGFTVPERDLPRAALIAAVLAHVRSSSEVSLARALGPPPGGQPQDAVLKPLRFKRLLAARQPDDLLIAFRRVVALLNGSANVKDLARLLLAWTDERFGDIARTRFAFDYHGAAFAAPDAADELATQNQELNP